MPDVIQNTLYLTTPGTTVARDHLTLLVKVPLNPDGSPVTTEDLQSEISNFKSVSLPIHNLESICAFGAIWLSPPALSLCWDHGVAVNYLTENGYLQARLTGVADTSVTLRRAQFRAADDPARAAAIARNIVAGKLQNARNSLLRAGRESESPNLKSQISEAADALARLIRQLEALQVADPKSQHSEEADAADRPLQKSQISNFKSQNSAPPAAGDRLQSPTEISNLKSQITTEEQASPQSLPFEISNLKSQITAREQTQTPPSETSNLRSEIDPIRGLEGMGSAAYFGAFNGLLKQQRDDFAFTTRTRRPPRDRVNCLLSFLYALVRHDCMAALTSIGLDPFVGFLHTDRPNRPSLALDLMEEFRPWLADRLAVTLINRQQIGPKDFNVREGGAVEFTDDGRKRVIKAYQERKQEKLQHPLLDQNLRIGQMPFVQARILARHLRGDIPAYVPFVPK